MSLFNIWEYVLRALQWFADWIFTIFCAPLYSLISDLDLPGLDINLADIADSSVWTLVNDWFPAEYALSCLVAYYTIALVVYGVNWVLGLIPTVS